MGKDRPTRRTRLPHASHETTRRAILDAALALFVGDGYDRVSIRNIAAAVDYSPGAIYSYFPSKDDIFLALAEEGFRKLGAGQIEMPSTDDALGDLAESAWRLYAFSVEQPQYFALVFLDRRVPRVSQAAERFAFMTEIKRHAHARVQRCIDEGLLPDSLDPTVALRLLWAAVMGLASLRVSGRWPSDADADALARDAIGTTIAGLRAGAASHPERRANRPATNHVSSRVATLA